MFFDSLVPNLVSGLGTLFFAVGVVLLLTLRDRFGATPAGARRLVWAIGFSELGVVLWIVALWLDGTAWLPGRIIATVAVTAGVAFAVWRLTRFVRQRRAQAAQDAQRVHP